MQSSLKIACFSLIVVFNNILTIDSAGGYSSGMILTNPGIDFHKSHVNLLI